MVFIRTFNFSFRLGVLIFVLNFRLKCSSKILKGDLRSKFDPCFHDKFLLILWRKSHIQSFAEIWPVFTKLWSEKVLNLTSVTSNRDCKNISSRVFFAYFLFILWKKNLEPFMVFLAIFHELKKVPKFWTNKLCLNISDIIHANEHTWCVNCGFHGNLWYFLLMLLCFMTKKDHFKQKFLLWPQFPFKISRFKFLKRINKDCLVSCRLV